jgi:type III secretory pathway component EscR
MAQESEEDTYSYKGWLNSDKFLKRAFAIYGYMMVASLIIAIPFYIIIFLLLATR